MEVFQDIIYHISQNIKFHSILVWLVFKSFSTHTYTLLSGPQKGLNCKTFQWMVVCLSYKTTKLFSFINSAVYDIQFTVYILYLNSVNYKQGSYLLVITIFLVSHFLLVLCLYDILCSFNTGVRVCQTQSCIFYVFITSGGL